MGLNTCNTARLNRGEYLGILADIYEWLLAVSCRIR